MRPRPLALADRRLACVFGAQAAPPRLHKTRERSAREYLGHGGLGRTSLLLPGGADNVPCFILYYCVTEQQKIEITSNILRKEFARARNSLSTELHCNLRGQGRSALCPSTSVGIFSQDIVNCQGKHREFACNASSSKRNSKVGRQRYETRVRLSHQRSRHQIVCIVYVPHLGSARYMRAEKHAEKGERFSSSKHCEDDGTDCARASPRRLALLRATLLWRCAGARGARELPLGSLRLALPSPLLSSPPSSPHPRPSTYSTSPGWMPERASERASERARPS